MAKTVSFGVLPRISGPGVKVAVGTIYGIASDGSFAVNLDSTGSQLMRNIQSVHLQPLYGSVEFRAQGSSNGYVVVRHSVEGSPIPDTSTAGFSFFVMGGGGSI